MNEKSPYLRYPFRKYGEIPFSPKISLFLPGRILEAPEME